MSEIFFTSLDETDNTRASHYFRNRSSAGKDCETRNAAAEGMGIKARYVIGSIDDSEITLKEKNSIRD